MSRWSERWWPSARKDDGFSLVEVVVALGILMVLVTTLLPQLVVGIRSTSTARLVTQAKGMAQAELENMRNLPYHVSYDAGYEGDFRDVLDNYYTNLTAPTAPPQPEDCDDDGKFEPPQPGWTGYVTDSKRCSFEPEGPFYRKVREVEAAEGISAFTIVTSTQFLSGETPPKPVTPPAGYNTQSADNGQPASAQIGVTVTVLYTDRASLRPTSMSTQIARQPSLIMRVRAQASAKAVEIGSTTPDGVTVSLTAGLLNLTGSLTHSSNVVAHLAAVSAGLGTGETGSGGSKTTAAPPTGTALVVDQVPGSLALTGCNLACWGNTRVDIPKVSAANALPLIAPAVSLLKDTLNGGFSFGNDPTVNYRDNLLLKPPLVQVDPKADAGFSGVTNACALTSSVIPSFVTAAGYLSTTEGGVETCAVARASVVSLFPTEFAPRGVVLIELRQASVRCQVIENVVTEARDYGAVATPEYEAVVKYWDGKKKEYVTAATITHETLKDPFDSTELATTATGDDKMLGDYISSWSGLTKGDLTASAVSGKEGEAQVKLPGVVTILTQPVREDATAAAVDPDSAIALTIGALSCSALDAR